MGDYAEKAVGKQTNIYFLAIYFPSFFSLIHFGRSLSFNHLYQV